MSQFFFNPKTNEITITSSISWEQTVSDVWDYYESQIEMKCDDDCEVPMPSEMQPEMIKEVMEAVQEELQDSDPVDWDETKEAVERAVCEYIEDNWPEYASILDCIEENSSWADQEEDEF